MKDKNRVYNQASLRQALKDLDILKFKEILEAGVDSQETDRKLRLSVFEECCQTKKCSEFIKACIQNGARCNKESELFRNKLPIHFAVESEDVDNLRIILKNSVESIDNVYEEHTPLASLAAFIEDDNYERVFDCIKLLIEAKANVNIPAHTETFIEIIAENDEVSKEKIERILKYILEHSEVDLDSYRDGRARKTLSDNFSKLVLPTKKPKIEWDQYKLLEQNSEEKFSIGFNKLLNTNKKLLEKANKELLVKAIDMGSFDVVKLIINSEIFDTDHQFKDSLKLACIKGYWKILELLLKNTNTSVNEPEPLLIIVIYNFRNAKIGEIWDYDKCSDIIINNANFNVNSKDVCGNTPLYISIKYSKPSFQLKLLEKGAFIGEKTKFNDYAIADIDSNLLENHLNNCITINKDYRSGDEDFEIIFDFKNFVPTDKLTLFDEISSIEYMSNVPELKNLIVHPLIAIFITLKFDCVKMLYFLNWIAYTCYFVLINLYLQFCYLDERCFHSTFQLVALGFGTLYVFIRTVQLAIDGQEGFKKIENYMEITLMVLTCIILGNSVYDISTRRTIAAFTILLTVWDFFCLLGTLPILAFSIHHTMLTTVTKTFFKYFLSYSIILMGFALSFYTLLGHSPEKKSSEDMNMLLTEADNSTEADSELNSFSNPASALLKTIVMSTGEFDAASIGFENHVASYILFVIFVFFITTVLFNLLNGLAVSDTQEIQSEAKLISSINRVQLLSRYEKMILKNSGNKYFKFINYILPSSRLFSKYIQMGKISVLPNQSNLVVFSNKQTLDIELGKKIAPVIYVDNGVIKQAKNVLSNKKKEHEEETEKKENVEKLKSIESKLNELLARN